MVSQDKARFTISGDGASKIFDFLLLFLLVFVFVLAFRVLLLLDWWQSRDCEFRCLLQTRINRRINPHKSREQTDKEKQKKTHQLSFRGGIRETRRALFLPSACAASL